MLLAAAATALTITVRVYDLYGLSAEERARALAVAGDTLARAHVSVVWQDCHRDPQKVLPPAWAEVLKRGEMALRFQRRTERGPHILGTAIVQEGGPNVLASVYVEPAGERSAKTGLPMTLILGRVTAHEIGHLLLGTSSHALSGLMQAKWDLRRPQPAEWQFTSADVEKIRDRLLATSVVQVVAAGPVDTTRSATTVMSSARPFAPARSSSAGGTSDR